MSGKKGLQRQVKPQVTAVVILIVLAAVQAVWWRFLVWKPKGGPAGPMAMTPMSGGPPIVVGRPDIRVDTLSGTPEAGDADGQGRNARFDGPAGMAIDAAGVLFVADCRNDRIRRIQPNGVTSTVAGGPRGYLDGSVGVARFNMPCGVAVAPDGTIYVADTGNHRIRRIRSGVVTTLAGSAAGMADGAGVLARFNLPACVLYVSTPKPGLFVADTLNRRVRFVSLDGVVSGGWAVPGAPTGLAAAPPTAAVPQASAILGHTARVVSAPVALGALAGAIKPGELKITRPVAICPSPRGWYLVDDTHGAVFELVRGVAEVVAGGATPNRRLSAWRDEAGDRCFFGRMSSIAADGRGHVYVSDTSNNAIRRLTMPEAMSAGEENGPESRNRQFVETLRRGNLWHQGDSPGNDRRGLRASWPQRGGQEHPDVHPRNPPGTH